MMGRYADMYQSLTTKERSTQVRPSIRTAFLTASETLVPSARATLERNVGAHADVLQEQGDGTDTALWQGVLPEYQASNRVNQLEVPVEHDATVDHADDGAVEVPDRSDGPDHESADLRVLVGGQSPWGRHQGNADLGFERAAFFLQILRREHLDSHA